MSSALRTSLIIGAVVLLSLVGGFLLSKWTSSSSLQFQNVELNPEIANLRKKDDSPLYGIAIETPSGNPESLLGLVGIVIVKEQGGDGKFSLIGDLRPPRDQILATPMDETIYQGIITNTADAKTSFTGFAASLQVDEAAEVLVRNELVIQYKDPQKIPYSALQSLPREKGKTYHFVDSVIVTSSAYKKYRKVKSSADVSGTAFATSGQIYASSQGFLVERKLRLRVIDPSLVRGGTIVEGAASDRLGELRQKSFPPGSKDLIHANVPLPQNLEIISNRQTKPENIVRIKGVPALKQDKSQGCWATAATMLYGWKTGTSYSVSQFLTKTCPKWLSNYESNTGLSIDEKNAFLNDVDFVYEAGASYLPIAVEEMLRKHGPLWFMVEALGNTHASIVIGMIRYNNTIYITYIDPADGEEYDEQYNSFHNRYEEPARWFNDDPILMKAFLKGTFYPAHVVHY